MNLLGKFTLALLACGLAPLLLATLFTHTFTKRALENTGRQAQEALETKAKDNVTSLVRAKSEHLATFVRGINNETQILSRTGRLGFLLESNTYYTFGKDSGLVEDLEEGRAHLKALYDEKLFSPNFPSTATVNTLYAHIDSLDENAIAAQLRYVFPPEPGAPLRPPPGNATPYEDIHSQLDIFWPSAMAHLGYRDVLLVDGERGDVVYSAIGGVDFGASFKEGPLADSIAARAYRRVWESGNDQLVFEDVAPYLPMKNAPVFVVGAPVHIQGKRTGVALFILGLDRFDTVLNTREPLEGDSTMYLVGPDYRPRSRIDSLISHPVDAGKEVDLSRLDIEPARIVFHLGEMGSGVYTGPSGQEALIAYAPIDVLGVTWALIAQVDTEVAFKAVRGMESSSKFFMNRILYIGDFMVIAAIVILCFVADYLAKPIVRPLRSTVAILKRMVQGEDALNQRLVVRGKDEVAELASAFNQFMNKLQQLYSSLENEINSRKAAQEEVERSQQYYKALIEHAPDVIVVFDDSNHLLFVSPSFERTFGYTTNEALNIDLSQWIHPDDMEAIAKISQEAHENPGAPVRSEYRVKHKDGHWVYVATVGTNHTEDTSIAGVVVNMRDITRRKEADRILREYSATLERDVTQRTIELQQNRDELAHTLEELRNAQDQLVLNEKMASLGALTAGIAHEIKNPLNFVTNFAELTAELAEELATEMEGPLSLVEPDVRENLLDLLKDIRLNSEKIEEHGKRADNIVKSMLLHSRGKKDARQPTDVNALLEEYVQLSYHGMRALDSTFNIELDVNLAPEFPLLDVVPQDLARVFLNILNNGCYAANQRKKKEDGDFQPKLTVSTEIAGDQAIIRIRDNGDGMPQETLEKIFTPFFTTKPAGAGTGLGLSISYDIVVQEHHGELHVDSEPGSHTEFQIMLPVLSTKQEKST